MRKDLIFGLFIALLTTTVACKHDENNPTPANNTNNGGNGNNNGNGNGTGGNNNNADTALCFQRDILPIFISNCAKSGCHDAASKQEGYVFIDYNTITSKDFRAGDPDETELFEKITENDPDKRMPPPPNTPLTSAQKALIERWIREGAKNTTDCGVLCDSNNFKYATAIQPLTEKYCKGCHSGPSAPLGVMLDSYAGTKAVADNGKLLAVIQHTPGFSAMPKGGAKLSDCQITQVKKWIANGAPND